MKHLAFLLLFCSTVFAGSLEDAAAGKGNLSALLKNEPLFILAPSFKGAVSRAYIRGSFGKDSPTKLDLHFNAFTPDGSRYSEPDCPHPKLPAILEAKPLEGNGFSTGTFAFSCDAPSIESLSACETLKDLQKVVPGLIRTYSEGSAHPGYWFNWFHLAEDGKLHLVLLSVKDEADGKLSRMEIWTGTLPSGK